MKPSIQDPHPTSPIASGFFQDWELYSSPDHTMHSEFRSIVEDKAFPDTMWLDLTAITLDSLADLDQKPSSPATTTYSFSDSSALASSQSPPPNEYLFNGSPLSSTTKKTQSLNFLIISKTRKLSIITNPI